MKTKNLVGQSIDSIKWQKTNILDIQLKFHFLHLAVPYKNCATLIKKISFIHEIRNRVFLSQSSGSVHSHHVLCLVRAFRAVACQPCVPWIQYLIHRVVIVQEAIAQCVQCNKSHSMNGNRNDPKVVPS